MPISETSSTGGHPYSTATDAEPMNSILLVRSGAYVGGYFWWRMALRRKNMSWYLRVLKKYAVFQGRAQRKEFWMFSLFNFIIGFVVGFFEGALGIFLLGPIYSVAIIIPGIAVGVRRMHDTDHSGWWVIVPFVNFYFWCIDGTSGDNRFGPDPKARATQ